MVTIMSIHFKPAIDPKDGAPLPCGWEVFGERASTIPCSRPATVRIGITSQMELTAYSIKKRTTWMVTGDHFCDTHADMIRSVEPFL